MSRLQERLTKSEYDRALHIHEEQQKSLKEWGRRLKNQEHTMAGKLKSAREAGRITEQQKTGRMVKASTRKWHGCETGSGT
jgi:hypothetical protein